MPDIVNIGAAPNDNRGHPLREAFTLINTRLQELMALLNSRGAWITGTAYDATARDHVVFEGLAYLCLESHTSSAAFSTDLSLGRWLRVDVLQLVFELAKAGGAAMLGSADGRTVQQRLDAIAGEVSAHVSIEADRAESARDAAQLSAGVFASAEAGIAATVDGDYFSVPLDSDDVSLALYRNVSGAAVEEATYPTARALPAANLRSSNYVPLVVDAAHRVPLWLRDGLLGAVGLAPETLAAILEQVSGATTYQPVHYGGTSRAPLATDGRSLWRFRARLAELLATGVGRVKVMMFGDSWTLLTAFTQAMADALYLAYGKAGDGWLPVEGGTINGITRPMSGWTVYDASSVELPVNGCAIDGHQISATGTAATLSLNGWDGTNLDIYYRETDGTFRYRVDGGSWVSVVGSGTGATGKVALSGLTEASHTLDIDLTGNTGTVRLYGFRSWRPAANGVELLKCGNGGLRADHLPKYMELLEPWVAEFDADVTLLVLGTNDTNSAAASVAGFTEAITDVIEVFKAQAPESGVVLVAPSDTNGLKAGPPLDELRDAHYAMALAQQVEFFNGLDDFPAFALGDAEGLYNDDLHLSATGSYHLTQRLMGRFLSIN